MPRVRLEIIPKPIEKKYAVFITDDGNETPYFESDADWDYLCGKCNFILISGYSLNQLQGDTVYFCPKCESYNLHH